MLFIFHACSFPVSVCILASVVAYSSLMCYTCFQLSPLLPVYTPLYPFVPHQIVMYTHVLFSSHFSLCVTFKVFFVCLFSVCLFDFALLPKPVKACLWIEDLCFPLLLWYCPHFCISAWSLIKPFTHYSMIESWIWNPFHHPVWHIHTLLYL